MIKSVTRFALITFLILGKPASLWADNKEFQINGKPVPSIVATVNGTKLTKEFLKDKVKTWRMASEKRDKPISPKQEENFVRNTIGQAIEQELLYQKGKELNIKVATKTIQQEIDNLQTNFSDFKMFLAALAFQHMSLEKLAEKIERQLTVDEIIRREIAPQANVTDTEVKSYYNQHKDSFIEPKKYRLSHIFTAKVNNGTQKNLENSELQKKANRMIRIINDEAREKVIMVFKKLKNGADFSEMANQFSEDYSKKSKDGNIGEVYMQQIDPVFAEIIFHLDVGNFSEIVEHKDGFHIFKLTHVKQEKLIPLEDIKTDILNSLLRIEVEKKKHEYIFNLKKNADIKIFL